SEGSGLSLVIRFRICAIQSTKCLRLVFFLLRTPLFWVCFLCLVSGLWGSLLR
ncbi:hypothetical protein U1Q18_009306, partial [Sarracenia purpurea var. burkii]